MRLRSAKSRCAANTIAALPPSPRIIMHPLEPLARPSTVAAFMCWTGIPPMVALFVVIKMAQAGGNVGYLLSLIIPAALGTIFLAMLLCGLLTRTLWASLCGAVTGLALVAMLAYVLLG